MRAVADNRLTTHTRAVAPLVLRFGVVLGVSSLSIALLSATVAVAASTATTGVVIRSLLVTLLLLLTARGFAARTSTLPHPTRLLLAGLTIAYAVNLTSWVGRGYAAQLAFDPGPLTAVVDLGLWLVVGCTPLLAGRHHQ